MNIEEQKRIAKEVLDKVKVLDYRAIIAGIPIAGVTKMYLLTALVGG